MPVPVWSLRSWEPVRTSVRELMRAAPRMRPLGVSFLANGAEARARQGQVLWGTRMAGRQVGIAWDWAEVRGNVVALADPMQVLSNMVIVDDVGAVMEKSNALLHLNTVIHHVEWQSHLCELTFTQTGPPSQLLAA